MAAPIEILFFVFLGKRKRTGQRIGMPSSTLYSKALSLVPESYPAVFTTGFPLGDHNARTGRIDALQSCVP